MSHNDLALQLAVLKFAMDRIAPVQRELRDEAARTMSKKERAVATVDGEPVGTVTKSSPDPKATVHSTTDLLGWMRENYPEHVTAVPFIENQPAAIAALLELKPELVSYRDDMDEGVVRDILDKSEAARQPVGPGGELDVSGVRVDIPDGSVSVRLEKGAEHTLEALFRAGYIDGAARGEIEA